MYVYGWSNEQLFEQQQILEGTKSPSIWIQHATYLHSIFKTWEKGNLWVYEDRIIYVGSEVPTNIEGTEIIDAAGLTIVPGYIEPHVHPFQLYNPFTFGQFAAARGTTTFIADNLMLFLSMPAEKSFALLDELKKQPFTYYWWSRFDSQTEMAEESKIFHPTEIRKWLEREDVVLGGELTGWPRLLANDEKMLSMIQLAKQQGKKVEGHFPGASDRTLARMRLFGVDGDHEAMTVDDVEKRLQHGYGVTLRHSSIRQDLSEMLKGIVAKGWDVFDHLMMTTDGSTPSFHVDGVMDLCIGLALDAGVSPIDAYQMAAYNVARYCGMSDVHGMIATGRIANLNFLTSPENPVPVSVLAKGEWVKKDGELIPARTVMDWSALGELQLDFDLTAQDFVWEHPIGIELLNDVITKPYKVETDLSVDELPADSDELFFMLVDRFGKWRVNAIVKGFATSIQGFASSYSNTGDLLLFGKSKEQMLLAFQHVKEQRGGISLVENGEVVAHLPLQVIGSMSSKPVEQLIEEELELKAALTERGYKFGDAIYTLLFIQSTHLPYVRVTQKGIVDVMKKEIIVPCTKR